jgi:hypothetical protein
MWRAVGKLPSCVPPISEKELKSPDSTSDLTHWRSGKFVHVGRVDRHAIALCHGFKENNAQVEERTNANIHLYRVAVKRFAANLVNALGLFAHAAPLRKQATDSITLIIYPLARS